jgi:hypothetical protein
MNDLRNSGLEDAALYIIASIVALVMFIAISEWLRARREREIYRQTRRNANNMVMSERQKQQRSAGN